MIVTMNSRSEHECIEIEEPINNQIVDLDFNGRYLIQCEYIDNEFIPTGNGVNGYGDSLSNVFYEHLVISIRG